MISWERLVQIFLGIWLVAMPLYGEKQDRPFDQLSAKREVQFKYKNRHGQFLISAQVYEGKTAENGLNALLVRFSGYRNRQAMTPYTDADHEVWACRERYKEKDKPKKEQEKFLIENLKFKSMVYKNEVVGVYLETGKKCKTKKEFLGQATFLFPSFERKAGWTMKTLTLPVVKPFALEPYEPEGSGSKLVSFNPPAAGEEDYTDLDGNFTKTIGVNPRSTADPIVKRLYMEPLLKESLKKKAEEEAAKLGTNAQPILNRLLQKAISNRQLPKAAQGSVSGFQVSFKEAGKFGSDKKEKGLGGVEGDILYGLLSTPDPKDLSDLYKGPLPGLGIWNLEMQPPLPGSSAKFTLVPTLHVIAPDGFQGQMILQEPRLPSDVEKWHPKEERSGLGDFATAFFQFNVPAMVSLAKAVIDDPNGPQWLKAQGMPDGEGHLQYYIRKTYRRVPSEFDKVFGHYPGDIGLVFGTGFKGRENMAKDIKVEDNSSAINAFNRRKQQLLVQDVGRALKAQENQLIALAEEAKKTKTAEKLSGFLKKAFTDYYMLEIYTTGQMVVDLKAEAEKQADAKLTKLGIEVPTEEEG